MDACDEAARSLYRIESDMRWKLERLPSGYIVSAAKTKEKGALAIAGHPSGRTFNSSDDFLHHLQWLMNKGQGGCSCILCNWEAQKKSSKKVVKRDYRWERSSGKGIALKISIKTAISYSRGQGRWKASVIIRVPKKDMRFSEVFNSDVDCLKGKENDVLFQVKTISDTNLQIQPSDGEIHQLHLCNIKPFNYWQVFLCGVDIDEAHPSIAYAMTLMSSLSVIGQSTASGTWPNTSISCNGIYIGSELLVRGDVVRLAPEAMRLSSDLSASDRATDVLVIEDIKVVLNDCEPDLLDSEADSNSPPADVEGLSDSDEEEWEVQEIVDCHRHHSKIEYKATYTGFKEWNNLPSWQPWTDFENCKEKVLAFHERHPRKPGPPQFFLKHKKGHICRSIAIYIERKAYTHDLRRQIVDAFPNPNIDLYKPWFRLHKSEDILQVTPDRSIGRLYEYDYMKRMFDGRSMSYDFAGVIGGRKYGRATNARISGGKVWLLSGSRSEALNMADAHSIEAVKYEKVGLEPLIGEVLIDPRDGRSKDSDDFQDKIRRLDMNTAKRTLDSRPASIRPSAGTAFLSRDGLDCELNRAVILNRSQS
ncbi:hypothetical protein KEM56_002497 [Ascosphaera pollenicola]|nr:hypothetical protein KEM56_002497 [Ascosphaera pollenicola]